MSNRPTPPLAVQATRKVSSWLNNLGISPEAFDDTVGAIAPLWRVHRLHARVIGKHMETPAAATVVLEVGPAFPMPRAGQYVLVSVVIDGVRHRRAYSPRVVQDARNQIAFTVQRHPQGLVSGHIIDRLQAGDIIEIDPPAGEFVLPSIPPAQLLLLAGGSGITPSMAMLEDLQRHHPTTQVSLLYFARSPQWRIFAQPLAAMARRWSGLHYVPLDTDAHVGGSTQGSLVLDENLLNASEPGWRTLTTYCCGPAPLMDAAKRLWAQAGMSHRLHLEAFAPPAIEGDAQARHQVALTKRGQHAHYVARGDQNLLDAGEQAGLSLQHGCRQGICHECTCRLQRGSVQDLTTGQRVDGEGQPIRLCVSAALSDLDLESMN